MSSARRVYPDWRTGDVLVWPNGTRRVVRDHSERYVTFAIKHRSWTGRPYTVRTKYELERQGVRLDHRPARVRLAAQDVLLRKDMNIKDPETGRWRATFPGEFRLTPEDVKGWP